MQFWMLHCPTFSFVVSARCAICKIVYRLASVTVHRSPPTPAATSLDGHPPGTGTAGVWFTADPTFCALYTCCILQRFLSIWVRLLPRTLPLWMIPNNRGVNIARNLIYYTPTNDMIYLLTAIGLSPGGSSTVHIYTQTVHRTKQNKQYIEQHNNLGECGPCPVLARFTLAFALQLRKKHGKTSVRVIKRLVIWTPIR